MIFLLLPAYNEENSIDPLIKKISKTLKKLKFKYKVLICNDGSTDKTLQKLDKLKKNFNIEIINHKINRGLGETSRDLFEKVSEISKVNDFIIRMDCDDTHEPKYIEEIIKKLNEGYDVVIASRFSRNGGQKGVSNYRSLISNGANL